MKDKQRDMSHEEAKRFVEHELGYCNFTRPRKQAQHPEQPLPPSRTYRLPKRWRQRTAELHAKLNDQVVPALTAWRSVAPAGEIANIDTLLRFAKGLKCTLKSATLQAKTSPTETVTAPTFIDAREEVVEVPSRAQKVA